MAINIQQITDFLLQNKSLSIEKIGRLSIGNPATGEGGNVSGTSFEYDKKAVTTNELYTYIAGLQNKNVTLVRADVDSFFEEARQLMNIGSRPLHFNGIGYIFSERNEGYKFSENSPVGFKESLQNNISETATAAPIPAYSNVSRRKGRGLKIFLFIIILALLAGIGYFVYSLLTQNKQVKDTADVEQTVLPDSVAATAPAPVAVNTPVAKSGQRKFVFETTPSTERMSRRTTQLRGLGEQVMVDTIQQNGQKQYKMYLPLQVTNAADTTRIKDSLSRYFGRPVVIE